MACNRTSPFVSVSKRGLVQNYEIEFDFHENEDDMRFNNIGFPRRPQKWSISLLYFALSSSLFLHFILNNTAFISSSREIKTTNTKYE